MNEINREIFQLIDSGEGQFVEFKKKVNHPEKIIREVVAFANAQGGNLFIGVDDNQQIAGLKYPEEDEFILSKAINELCRPAIDFQVSTLRTKDGIVILHYTIEAGSCKPYFAFLEKKHKYGKAFIRVNDQSIQTSYEMRQVLKKSNHQAQPIVIEDTARKLFNYLDKNPHITRSQFAELAGINQKLASSKLVDLTLSGALKIEPREGEDFFYQA